MNGRVWIAVACALYAGALALRPGPAPDPAAHLRTVARPWVLPFLWRAHDQAARRGADREATARARLLMEMLPGWTDGHILFAWRLVLRGRDDPADTVDRLGAALEWLERARTANPDRAHEVLAAAGLLVRLVAERSPGHARLVRERFGRPARQVEVDYLERAHQLHPSRSLFEARVFAGIGVVASALRLGDLDHARELIPVLRRDLRRVRDRDLAAEWQDALGALGQYLEHRGEETYRALKRHRLLSDLLDDVPPPR